MSENIFDFDNTSDLDPAVASLVEANVQSNEKRDAVLAVLGSAPRALTYKELYVAALRSGLVEKTVNEAGEAVIGEDGSQATVPAVSTVGQWVRNAGYGAVQVKRGYYAMPGSDADSGERYEHKVSKSDGEEAPAAEPTDMDDLGDL